ncbi:MAG: hypothetical protein ACJAT1_001656 [Marivirga sp.]|jgi:hypothetical protein
MRTLALIISLLTICIRPLIGQRQKDFESIVEQYFPVMDKDLNYEEICEQLYQYYQSPLNLNTADRKSLEQLNLLSFDQINSLLEYREVHGRLLSVFELQAVPLFDLYSIRKIQPFIKVTPTALNADNRSIWSKIMEERNSYLIIRTDRSIETKKGYKELDGTPKYIGTPYRLYSKLRIQHTNDFSIGLTMEKDAGETFNWDPAKDQYLFDYYSFHLQLKNKGVIKNIVLGDYQLQYGQSLVFGAGFSLGKGAHAIATARLPTAGISPYGSVMEKQFFRGIATTVQLHPNWELTSFYSNSLLDARIGIDSTNTKQKYIQSTNLSGLHHTAATKSRKNNATIQNMGGTLLYSSKRNHFNAGVNYLFTAYEFPLSRNERKYSQYSFAGKTHHITSIFSNYYWKNTHLFTEYALSTNGDFGVVSGMILSLSGTIQLSLLARHYGKQFHSPMGAAFGENTKNNNETGIYLGIRNDFSKRLTFTAYLDKYKSPWLQYLVDKPAGGHEFLGRLNYSFNKKALVFLQFRYKSDASNSTDNTANTYMVSTTKKRNITLNYNLQANPIIALKSRIQYSDYQAENELTRGIAIIQDVDFNFKKLRINARYALFDTENYENRQYVYEKDVLYAFSIPAYQNTGVRSYILVQYKISKNIKIWAKWSQFRYFGEDDIGSGNETIEGDTKSDIKFQILLKL